METNHDITESDINESDVTMVYKNINDMTTKKEKCHEHRNYSERDYWLTNDSHTSLGISQSEFSNHFDDIKRESRLASSESIVGKPRKDSITLARRMQQTGNTESISSPIHQRNANVERSSHRKYFV